MTKDYLKVANPGSAIGEAIGASMEKALQAKLEELADYIKTMQTIMNPKLA